MNIYTYIYMYIYNIYTCISTPHKVLKSPRSKTGITNAIIDWLSLKWLCGNSSTCAHDVCDVQ